MKMWKGKRQSYITISITNQTDFNKYCKDITGYNLIADDVEVKGSSIKLFTSRLWYFKRFITLFNKEQVKFKREPVTYKVVINQKLRGNHYNFLIGNEILVYFYVKNKYRHLGSKQEIHYNTRGHGKHVLMKVLNTYYNGYQVDVTVEGLDGKPLLLKVDNIDDVEWFKTK